jgi:hypothetical protein
MLMENTLKLEEGGSLKHIFDLKGSKVGRTVKSNEDGSFDPSTTLKDQNLI